MSVVRLVNSKMQNWSSISKVDLQYVVRLVTIMYAVRLVDTRIVVNVWCEV